MGVFAFNKKTEKSHQLIGNQIKLTATSPIFSDLIERCLQQDPIYRPTAVEIETALILHKNEFNSRISSNLTYSQLSSEERNELEAWFHPDWDVPVPQNETPPGMARFAWRVLICLAAINIKIAKLRHNCKRAEYRGGFSCLRKSPRRLPDYILARHRHEQYHRAAGAVMGKGSAAL